MSESKPKDESENDGTESRAEEDHTGPQINRDDPEVHQMTLGDVIRTFKQIKEHVRECEQTNGSHTPEVLMLRESNAEMRLEMEEMRQKMMKMENKQKEEKAEVESRSEVLFEMLDSKEKNLTELIEKMRKDLQRDLQNLKIQTEQEVTSMEAENNAKMEKLASKTILDLKENLLNEKISSLNRDLKNEKVRCSSEKEVSRDELDRVNGKADAIKVEMSEWKLEMETRIENVKAEMVGQLKKQNAEIKDLGEKLMAKIDKALDQSVLKADQTLKERPQPSDSSIETTLKKLQQKIYKLEISIFQIKPQMDIYNLCEKNTNINTVYSNDGLLCWSIDNYRKRKLMEEEGLVRWHESPYFSLSPTGFRVRACVCLNGWGEYIGKGLSVKIRFFDGKRAHFSVYNSYQTTVTLLNRKHPEHSITKRIEQDIGSQHEYFIDVCANEDIECLLEQNDTLYYDIKVNH